MKSNATKGKKRTIISHVVHDYANLVSAGTMAVSDQHNAVRLAANSPLNHHVGEAFLTNCRKMYDFFNPPADPRDDDILARDFLGGTASFSLPQWFSWRDTMNKQLL